MLQPDEKYAGVRPGREQPPVGETAVRRDQKSLLTLRKGHHVGVGTAGEILRMDVLGVMTERA